MLERHGNRSTLDQASFLYIPSKSGYEITCHIKLLSVLYFYTHFFRLIVNIFSDAECTYRQLVTGTGGKLKPVTEAVDGIFCAV